MAKRYIVRRRLKIKRKKRRKNSAVFCSDMSFSKVLEAAYIAKYSLRSLHEYDELSSELYYHVEISLCGKLNERLCRASHLPHTPSWSPCASSRRSSPCNPSKLDHDKLSDLQSLVYISCYNPRRNRHNLRFQLISYDFKSSEVDFPWALQPRALLNGIKHRVDELLLRDRLACIAVFLLHRGDLGLEDPPDMDLDGFCLIVKQSMSFSSYIIAYTLQESLGKWTRASKGEASLVLTKSLCFVPHRCWSFRIRCRYIRSCPSQIVARRGRFFIWRHRNDRKPWNLLYDTYERMQKAHTGGPVHLAEVFVGAIRAAAVIRVHHLRKCDQDRRATR